VFLKVNFRLADVMDLVRPIEEARDSFCLHIDVDASVIPVNMAPIGFVEVDNAGAPQQNFVSRFGGGTGNQEAGEKGAKYPHSFFLLVRIRSTVASPSPEIPAMASLGGGGRYRSVH
jgi:hypothetical protein